MAIDNTRVLKLREYLMNVISQIDTNYKQVNFNYLSNDTSNYSLDKIPTTQSVEAWIIGDIIHVDIYSFRSRMNYSAEVMSNINNVGFFETFEKIIKQNNENGILPDIPGIESIKCLNCGTFVTANSNTCEFDIQIQIKYREVESQDPSQ